MIGVILGDITKIPVDAIVNAANNGLWGGGGVDGVIHRAGGKTIAEECTKIREKTGGCKTGESVYTLAGNLPSKYIIHTIGPVWAGGNKGEQQLLFNSYYNSLILAENLKVKTISFPNISTGVYRYPRELAAKEAFNAVRSFMQNSDSIEKLLFVCFDNENYSIYQNIMNITTD